VKITIELTDVSQYEDLDKPMDIKKVKISNSAYEDRIILDADGKKTLLWASELISAVKRCSGTEAVLCEGECD